MNPSSGAFALIKRFEGCAKRLPDGRLQAYPDPATGRDPWTIGWGSTGPDVRPGVIWSQGQADARMETDAKIMGGKIERYLDGAPTSQHQFDAMVSFSYNLGVANLVGSTLFKKHKAGDYAGAQAEFGRWNKAGGKVMSGLTTRRAAEAALYGRV